MSEPWEDFATTPAATTEAEAGPWQDFAGQEAGPWTDFKPAADLQPISTGSKVAARAASGLEKGMAMPERAIRAGLDLLGWYKALDAVSGTGNKYQDYNRQWLEYFKQRDQQLSKEDAAIGAQGFGYDVVEGVSRVATELPVQLMGGTAGAVRGAAVKGAALTAGTTAGLTQAADDLAEGRSQLESAAYGATSGLITGLTTGAFGTTGVEAVFAKEGVRGVARRVLEVLKQAGLEGAEEAVDEFQQDLLERTTRQPDKPVADTVNQLLLSGTVGALLGGGMATANAVRPTPGPPANRQAASLEKELTSGDRAPVIERTIEAPPVETENQRFAREQREASQALARHREIEGAIEQVRQDILKRQTPKAWQPLSPTPETTPAPPSAGPSRPAIPEPTASQPGAGTLSTASRGTPALETAAVVSPEATAANLEQAGASPGLPPAQAEAGPTPGISSIKVTERQKRRDLRNPYAMFGEFSGDTPAQGIAGGLAAERGDVTVFLTNARSGSTYVKMVENTTGETVNIRFSNHFAPGGGGFRVTEMGSGREAPPDFNIVKNKIYSLEDGKWVQINLNKLRWHLENWLPAKPENANAPVAGGAAGIKTPLETQSQMAEAQADKSNMTALQSGEGSALTTQTSPQPTVEVKPRHLKEARAALEQQAETESSDVLNDIADQVTRGSIRLPEADFATMLADLRDAVAELLYRKPYEKLRRDQKRKVDAQHRLSTTEGLPVDQVLTGIAALPKYANWTADDLIMDIGRAVARRNTTRETDSPQVKALAQQIAEAEAGRVQYPEHVDEALQPFEKPTGRGLYDQPAPPPAELREGPVTATQLDKLAQDIHGSSYADLESWQQEAIRRAAEAGTRPSHLSAASRFIREHERAAASAQPAAQGTPRQLQPAPAKAGTQRRVPKLTGSAQRVAALRFLERYIKYLDYEIRSVGLPRDYTQVSPSGKMVTTEQPAGPDHGLRARLELERANASEDFRRIYATQEQYMARLRSNPRWQQLQTQHEQNPYSLTPEQRQELQQLREQAEPKSTTEDWADRTIAEGKKRLATGLDPELLAAYAVKGAYVIARGVRDFAAWTAEMLRQIPELARASEQQLRELFARSTDIADGRDPEIGLSLRGMKLRADESLSDKVREGVAAEYQKRTSAGDNTEAYRLITEAGGPEQAATAILQGKWDALPEPIAVKAAGQVLKMLADLERTADPARANALADQQIAIANWSTRNATRPAQWLQSFASLYANYSPAAWLKQWRAGVYEAARQRLERVTRQPVPEDPIGQARTVAGQVAEDLKPDAPTAADVIGDVFGGKGQPGESVEQAVTRRTGKTGEAARKLAKKITDLYEKEVAKFRKRHKIPELTPEEEREVLRRAKEIGQLPADSLQRRKAALELMDALHKRKGFEWWELPVAFWYANVLSGPTTHAKNIIGNAVNLGMEAGLQTLLRPTNLPAILEALARSLPVATREAASILRTGRDTAARHGNKFELRRNPMELQTNPALNTLLLPWKLVGRFLRAEDAVFFNAAQEMRAAILARRAAGQSTAGMREAMGWTPEARTKAEAQAASEGLTGLDYQRRVTEIIEQARPDVIMQAAREFGYDATFTNDPYGVLGAFTNALGHAFNYAPALKPFILPFPRIVANVFNAGLNWTPVGAVRAARGQRRLAWLGRSDTLGKLYGREITDPLAIRDAYARAAVGTAAVLGLIAAALQNVFDEDPWFLITAGGPNSKAQRDLLRSTGWIPYSLKIGNRYYSYHDKTPQAILAVVGNYVDAVRYKNLNNEDALNRATYALQSVTGVMVDSSWLQGLNNLFDAANRDSVGKPQGGLVKQAVRTGSGFVVPAFVRQIDQFFDPTRYQSTDVQGMLLAQTPFARRSGKPDLNVWGEPVSSPTSKIFWSKVEGDALTQRLAGARLFPSLPEQSDLTPEEHYALIKLRGPMLRQALLENADEWIGQPRMLAQDAVNRISAAATAEAKAQLGLDEAGRTRRQLRKLNTR